MKNKPFLLLGICAIALNGCSSRPRNFAPVLSVAPTDPQLFEAHWLDCRDQVAAVTGKRSERLASAGGGAVAGVGAGVAASAAVSGATYASFGAMATAAAAAMAVVPVFGLAGAWGISKIKKTKKERVIKSATAQCMAGKGYAVEKWRVMPKREVRALDAAAKQSPQPLDVQPAPLGASTVPDTGETGGEAK